MPFCPFHLRVPFLKQNSRKKGTLIISFKRVIDRNLGIVDTRQDNDLVASVGLCSPEFVKATPCSKSV